MWNELSLARLGLAFFLSCLVAGAGWRAKALSTSGAVAAFLMGGVVFGLGGWGAAAVLLTFFVTSSLLSRAFAPRKKSLNSVVPKGIAARCLAGVRQWWFWRALSLRRAGVPPFAVPGFWLFVAV
jgi:uncharacterized membrane protein